MTRCVHGPRVRHEWRALALTLAVLCPATGRAQTPASPPGAAAGPSLRAAVADVAASAPLQAAPAVPSRQPFSGTLTLKDAIQRGVEYNLATMGLTADAARARADRGLAKSALMPNLTGDASVTSQRINLAAEGVVIEVPNFSMPSVTDPFHVLDARARVTQTIYDATLLSNLHASEAALRATSSNVDDARNRIVLMVGTAYLEAVAAQSRLQLARAQVATAQSVQQKAEQQQGAGLATPLDVSRTRVDTLNARQRVTALEADVAKKKIDLARMIGVTPGDQYEIARDIPYSAAPTLTLEQALAQAMARPDVAAATEELAAAERTLESAKGARLPTVSLLADFGASQAMSEPTRATYTVAGVVRVPIWQGGRVEARVEQAAATVAQRRVQVDDIKAQIEADVRRAYVDLRTADGQVAAARESLQVMHDTLAYVQQQFGSGLAEDVTVARAREAVASAELDYTNAVFSHNLAKLTLARAVGRASGDLAQFLLMP